MHSNRRKKFDRFNDEFENQSRVHGTKKEAYYATEKKFNDILGYDQYSGYDSFRKLRERRRK